MLEVVFIVIYIVLFVLSFRRKYALYILPLFVFCYPANLSVINVGNGFGLDDIFILSHYLKCLFAVKHDGFLDTKVRRWRLINFSILLIYILSNLFGYASNSFENFIFLDFIKGTLQFTYTYFICYIYCTYLITNFLRVKYSLIFAAGYQALIAIAVYHHTNYFVFFYDSSDILLSGDVTFRAVGSMSGPWELGGFLAIGLVLAYTELISRNKKSLMNVVFLLSILVLILYAVIISTSRASWLFVFFSVAVLILNRTTKQLVYAFIIAFIGSLLLETYLETAIELIQHRVLQTTGNGTGQLDNSSEQRFLIWKMLYREYDFFYSLIGYGWQNFIKTFQTTPHNGILSAYLSTGILGIFVYIKYFRTIWSNRNSLIRKQSQRATVNFGVPAILVGLLAYSLTTDTLFTNSVFKFLTIIGTLSVLQHQKYFRRENE